MTLSIFSTVSTRHSWSSGFYSSRRNCCQHPYKSLATNKWARNTMDSFALAKCRWLPQPGKQFHLRFWGLDGRMDKKGIFQDTEVSGLVRNSSPSSPSWWDSRRSPIEFSVSRRLSWSAPVKACSWAAGPSGCWPQLPIVLQFGLCMHDRVAASLSLQEWLPDYWV